ncbi:hypothetical protein K439DRAFT_1612159 [Ramaria rubella]|nr:hypothetical protein K439DRAFT_1612159 [Ramaria rubella]
MSFYFALRYSVSSASYSQPSLRREISRSVICWLLIKLNVAQLQWVMPNCSKAYEDWICATWKRPAGDRLELITEVMEKDGIYSKLHWIGRRDFKKVLLYYHGDLIFFLCSIFVVLIMLVMEYKGEVLLCPYIVAICDLFNYFCEEIKCRSGEEVKIALPEYTLTPHAKYPTQYQQAVLTLQHILASGISPADIVISGDSAGGMLMFQVLSHILHPHPLLLVIPVPSVLFAGILAISLWLIFECTAPSIRDNVRDLIAAQSVHDYAEKVCKGSVLSETQGELGGYWSEPLKAPAEWWDHTGAVTGHLLLTYGEWEFLRDHVVLLGETLDVALRAGGKVDLMVWNEQRGIHDSPVMDTALGRAPNDITKAIAGWIHDRIVD